MSRAALKTRTSSRALWCALALPIAVIATPAQAQEVDGEVSMQRFDAAPGPGNFITTRSVSAIAGHLDWTAALLANYSYEPFTVVNCATDCSDGDPRQEIKVVENMVTGDLMGSLSLIEMLQIGLKVPVTWAEGHGLQQESDGTFGRADGELSEVSLGDVQLEAKARLYELPEGVAAFGAYAYGSAPTGSLIAEGSYIGNESPTFGGAAVVDGSMGPISYGVNLGGMWRKRARIGEKTTVGPEARWGAALGYEISPILKVVADGFGGTDFDTKDLGATSVEVDLGVHLAPLGNQIKFLVGGGAGALKGVGVPTARAFLGFAYDARVLDRDGDGLSDDVDACANAAEDVDGFEDGDGCPETDNDHDGLPDQADKCPNQAEDVDGFEDKDGCPDVDNDKDGIQDTQDRCPLKPETKNGFEDADGCPDVADRDSDGVPDTTDKCIDAPEDTDGFEDTDGCPDPDNDQDGIPDDGDECIDEPEDGEGEGPEVEDGCPLDA